VFGVMAVTQAVLPHMRRAGAGRIVNVSSVAGRIGSMSIGGYASSKFAVEGLAECLWQEMIPFGVHVSLLEPGLVLTPHFTVRRNRARRAADPSSPYFAWFCEHERIVDRILQRRQFGPAEIARVVERILRARRPRLRYLVGLGARLIVGLRRHVPGEWFERTYWGLVRRLVTRPRLHAPALTNWVGPPERHELTRTEHHDVSA
jgi:NAD(P)-dependent dehydrogenase (short-subunit alcohol dehydrogenase family)